MTTPEPLAPSALPSLAAFASTYNDAATGTFGQTILASSPSTALGPPPGASIQAVPGVARTATFRTNLGATNGSALPTTLSFTLHDRDGALLARRAVTLAPLDSWQTDLFDWIGNAPPLPSDLSEASLVVTLESGGPAWVYASRVDNRTGDPTFIPATSLDR